mgnify:CR=1 FL=1
MTSGLFPIRICIEGNIGSGKEDIVNLLKTHFNNNRTIFIPDVINNWKNKENLEKFYTETSKYAFITEIKSTVDKINSISNIKKQIIFFNKSWISIKECFVKTLHETKFLTDLEKDTYDKTYNALISKDEPTIDLIIYVKNSPRKCYENIMQRNIKYENNITLNFLTKLHNYYEKWMSTSNHHIYVVNIESLSEEQFINDIFNFLPAFKKIYTKSV